MPETHRIWDEFNSTDIWGEIFLIRLERHQNKMPINSRIQIGFSCRPSSILPLQIMQQSIQGSTMERDIQRRWIVSIQG